MHKVLTMPSPYNWEPKDLRSWCSSFTPKQYRDAQTGRAAHPLKETIERTIDAAQTVGYALAWDVAGAAPDVGAYLAGEPECMVYQEERKQPGQPLDVYIDLTSEQSIKAHDVAQHIAAACAACYSLAQSRPVKIIFYCWNTHGKSKKTYLNTWPAIDCDAVIDCNLLALMADTRTARELGHQSIHDQHVVRSALFFPSEPPPIPEGAKNVPGLRHDDKIKTIQQFIDEFTK